MTEVVPIRHITKSFPEAGRIRLGIKTDKGFPKALDTFRLTSQYKPPLEQAAALWGGQVRPWNDQYEVVTQTNSLSIILPLMEGFDPLGGTPIYELWSGGGCQRRCDGETVETPQQSGPDTVEMVASPCICAGKGVLECSVKLRLIVGLPDLDFYGFWRLETGSMYAVRENQAMLQLIASLQAAGIHRGLLTLERREAKKPGVATKKFVVPIIRLAGSMNELAAGTTGVRAIGTAPQPELTTTSSPVVPFADEDGEPDDDAPRHSISGSPPVSEPEEVVEAGTLHGEGGASSEPASSGEDVVDAEVVEEWRPADAVDASKLRAAFMAIVKGENCKLNYENDVRPFLQHHYDGRSWSELTVDEKHALVHMLTSGSRADKNKAQREFAEKVRAFAKESAA